MTKVLNIAHCKINMKQGLSSPLHGLNSTLFRLYSHLYTVLSLCPEEQVLESILQDSV
jgi:hypothetical protein